MADICVPSLIIIDAAIEQLGIIVSKMTIYCLRLCVVYKQVMLQGWR